MIEEGCVLWETCEMSANIIITIVWLLLCVPAFLYLSNWYMGRKEKRKVKVTEYKFYPCVLEDRKDARVELIKDNKIVIRANIPDAKQLDLFKRLDNKNKKSGLMKTFGKGHLCGYVIFRNEDVPSSWYSIDSSYLEYLSIHGGLTYFGMETQKKVIKFLGMRIDAEEHFIVFGFDCAHADDENDERLQDPEFVMQLCEDAEVQIKSLIKWRFILRIAPKKMRAKILDRIRARAKVDSSRTYGFGLMIESLTGFPKLKGREKR